MKKFLLVLISILIFPFMFGCKESQIDDDKEEPIKVSLIKDEQLNSNYINWHGRHHYLDKKEYFYHTGSGFTISFYGSNITIDFNLEDKKSNIYFKVSHNNQDLLESDDYVLIESERKTYYFDEFTNHIITFIKRSEPQDGVTSISSISTNGYFNEVEVSKKPHFLLIGASGISGHGALGESGQPRTTENSSSLHSFGYLTAKHYGGTFEFVSNSGWGLKFGFNDRSGNTNLSKAYLYVGIDSNNNIVEKDFTKKEADYIIVNAGGNDFSAVVNTYSGFEKEEKVKEFKRAVLEFIKTLRKDHPNAHIILTMTTGSQNGRAANDVILLLDPEDKPFVQMVIIKQVGEAGDPVGANNHASYITHQKSAQNIIEAIDMTIDNKANYKRAFFII